ncbi:MAG: glycosyltransferase [Goleter apudmare HA4340-LM2]|jgi:glycosyltransferase involved in cell wall biosynthesis|nr:glycosyltransferase [Goleter apudmare HA4340-LM2]
MEALAQEQVKQLRETKLASFSIIFETENLASVELENIYKSLASIANQDISPEQANEFLIIDSGYAPQEVINEICAKYPWITVQKVPGLSYYEAKMLGAKLATGDIIVYCDSDCVYVSNWLRNILTTFLQSADINVVAGETSTPVRNAYELAIAIHYFFPRFSYQEQPYKSDYYFLNAVAFRRDFLMQYPIPTNLPLYRGNCDIHGYSFHFLQGKQIWKHPQAQATHEPPTLSFCVWRYLLMGRDRVLKERIKYLLVKNIEGTDDAQLSTELNWTIPQKIRGIISIIKGIKPFNKERIQIILQEDKSRYFTLPLALPIVLYFELIFAIGSIITYLERDLLLRLYYQSEEK